MPSNFNSNYWETSTSITASNVAFSKHNDIIIVGSNSLTENLKVYQFVANSLIHLSSITLPDVHKLQFLKPTNQGDDNFKFLLSGHSNGIIHLSAIPLNENSVFKDAEIIKRFNHRKKINKLNTSLSHSLRLNNGHLSTTISEIQLTPNSWSSIPFNSLISLYDHHLFLWDSSRSHSPLRILQTNNTSSVSLNSNLQSLIAIGGDFGIRLLDLKGNDQNILFSNSKLSSGLTNVQWCDDDEYLLSATDPIKDSVLLWDIRKNKPLKTINNSHTSITSTKWLGNQLWIGESNGNLTRYNSELESPLSFKASNKQIVEIDYTSNFYNLLCMDQTYLSTHNLKRNHQPRPIPTIKFNETKPLVNKRIQSSSSLNSSSSVFTSHRVSSDSSQGSNNSLSQNNQIRSSDYLVSFQKEIDQMLNSMQRKVVDDIVYI